MLDVNAAEEHLQAAKRALNNNKYEAADGALAAVQRGVSLRMSRSTCRCCAPVRI
jgi:hypothetical protein